MAKDNPENTYDYTFKVLQERVATKDLFEDKTHEKVATTLKSLIDSADSGMTIGLEGGWGSGKSTVINLLKDKLTKESGNKTLFFSFDAWAHDGDPLRKIFLESLISSIDPNKTDQKLNQLQEEVSARKKSVKVKTEKSASKLGKWLSLSALPIPVGAALLSAVNYDKLHWPFTTKADELSFTFIFGFLLALSPLWLLTYWRYWGDRDENKQAKWDIFESESEENYTQDITEDGERTSIEFEKFFNEILSHVLDSESSFNYTRVVIVIDNLDRVDADHAQNVWSTLQTFFQHRSSSTANQDWVDKIWFIIPYDREGINRSWQVEQNGNCNVAASFMEKCFQVITEVPTPVMSAWISYFVEYVDKAFIGWPKDAKKAFTDTYIRCMSKLDSSPSPRQIHNHINRAGMLGMHWKDSLKTNSLSAEAICLYALYRQEMTESTLRNALLAEGLPKGYQNHKPYNELKPEIAGMLFGVGSTKGMELLLSPEIKAAIKEGNGEELTELANTHKEAFWLVLRANESEWLPTTEDNDQDKINALEALYNVFKSNRQQVKHYILLIQQAFLDSFEQWDLKNFSYRESLEQLIALSENHDAITSSLNHKMLNKIKTSFSKFTKDEIDAQEIVKWGEINALLNHFNKPLTTNFYPELEGKTWQHWLNLSDIAGVEITSILPAARTFSYLIDEAGFKYNDLYDGELNTLVKTYTLYSEPSVWKGLVEALIDWLNTNQLETVLPLINELLAKLYGNISIDDRKKLEKCFADSDFWQNMNYYQITLKDTFPFIIAIYCSDFRNNAYVVESISTYLGKELSEEEIKSATDVFVTAKAFEKVWKLASDKANPFALQIIRAYENTDLFEYGGYFLDEIHWESEEELASITQKLCDNGAIEKIQNNIKEDPNAYHRTIHILSRFGDESAKHFVTSLLETLKREQWHETLKQQNELLQHIPENSSVFSKAWADYVKAIVQGTDEKPDLAGLKQLVSFRFQILDYGSIHQEEITTAYFNEPDKDPFTEEEFTELKPLFSSDLSAIDRINVERRISYWIEKNNLSKIQWFIDADFKPKGDSSEDIKAIVKQHIKSGNEEMKEACIKLNQKLALNIDLVSLEQHNDEEVAKPDDDKIACP